MKVFVKNATHLRYIIPFTIYTNSSVQAQLAQNLSSQTKAKPALAQFFNPESTCCRSVKVHTNSLPSVIFFHRLALIHNQPRCFYNFNEILLLIFRYFLSFLFFIHYNIFTYVFYDKVQFKKLAYCHSNTQLSTSFSMGVTRHIFATF